jgi:O-antigen/teichoic acid export membrane protein
MRKSIAGKLGKLAQDTLTMTTGLGLRTVAQTVIFLIVAHVLGVNGYGAFAAVVALASALATFVGLGTQVLLVRNLARDTDTFAESWGVVLGAITISVPIIVIIYLITAWLILPQSISFLIVLVIGIADLVFGPFTVCAINVYRGHEHIGKATRLLLAQVFIRLVAAVLLLILSSFLPSIQWLYTWAVFYAGTHFLAAVYALRQVFHDFGKPVFPSWCHFLYCLREGLPFSFGGIALRLYADIDKTMLARLSTLEIAGVYSVAYRIVDIATLPLHAFLNTAQTRFFRAGHGGAKGVVSYALNVFPLPLIYCLLAGAFLCLSADLLPWCLGKEYDEAVSALRWLAWLPAASLIRLFAQMALLTSGHQKNAVWILIFGAITNIILNLWLIPIMHWHGAVIATYVAEGFMTAIMVGLFVLTKIRRGVFLSSL